MKNHRFLWLRNRTTDNRKCEKARNIKEKRTIEMFSMASRRRAALLSSPRDNFSEIHIFGYSKSPTVPAVGLFIKRAGVSARGRFLFAAHS